MQNAFSSKGIPVFLGETTSGYPISNFVWNAESKKSSDCVEYVLNRLCDYGFVPVLWDTNSHFYSRIEYEVKNQDDREMIFRVSERYSNE